MLSIADADGYKNKMGEDRICVVIKIPKEYLEYTEGKTKPILFQTDHMAEQGGGMAIVKDKYQTVLLPEFILGAVEYKKGEIQPEFQRNVNYRKVHDYQNNGLVYPRETIQSFKEYQKQENDHIYQHRTEDELKEFSMNEMTTSKFQNAIQKFKQFFHRKEKEDKTNDREEK